MRKWLLLAVFGLVLLYVLTLREGVDATLTPQPTCRHGASFDGVNCIDSNNIVSSPMCRSGYYFSGGKCVAGTPPTSDLTRYSDILAVTPDTVSGSLPAPINETAPPLDVGATRPMTGPVFGENGPFSGQAGTGQGTGVNVVASSYGHPPPGARLDPYDLWPGTKGSTTRPVLTGSNMDVQGPSWGGRASGGSSSGSSSVAMTAQLYGPGSGDKSAGLGSGHPQINSVDVSMLPDFNTTGSDPSNQYAGTSRVPGDQDLFPTSYLQSSSYSIANGSQKTDPVPFLSDFSVFQS